MKSAESVQKDKAIGQFNLFETSEEEELPDVRIAESADDDPHEDRVELVLGDATGYQEDVDDEAPSNEPEDEPSEEIVAVDLPLEEVDEADPEKLAVLPVVPPGVPKSPKTASPKPARLLG